MRTIIVVIAVVAFVAVITLGWSTVTSHLGALREDVKESVNEASSMEHTHRRLAKAVEKEYKKLEEYWVKIKEAEQKYKSLSETNERLKAKLEKERNILPKAVAILEQYEGEPVSTEVEIRGSTYTLKEVQEDLDSRMERCKRLESTLASNRKDIVQLRETVNLGKQRIDSIQDNIAKLEKEADKVLSEYRREQFEAERIALEASLRDDLPSISVEESEAARLLDVMKNRLNGVEASNEMARERMGETEGRVIVDYEKQTDRNTLAEARQYISSADSSDDEETVVVRPDIGQALEDEEPASVEAGESPAEEEPSAGENE